MDQFVKQYQHTHERIYNYLGESSKKTMQLAAAYTLANKPFSGMALQKKMDELNELLVQKIDTYYTFRANVVNINVAAQFIIGDEAKTDFEAFKQRVQYLIDAGFPKKASTVTAALYVENGNHAKCAYELYEAMKTYHPILTGIDDIPISVFITRNKELISRDVAKLMNVYYNELKKSFIPGEALQLLSQLLVLWSAEYNKTLVPYVTQLKVEFKKRGIRVSRSVYPFLGILALDTSDTAVIDEIKVMFDKLCQLKLLKFNKDIALQIAIQRITHQKAEEMKVTTLGNGAKLAELLDNVQFLIGVPLDIGDFFSALPFGD